MIEPSIKDEFLDLFYADIVDLELENSNRLNVFTLRISNNSFAYSDLVEHLGNKLYHFALSRNEIKVLKESDQLNTLIRKSKEKLVDYIEREKEEKKLTGTEGGELGELLLYCLLECHLKAPKILTKLEIKTSQQKYVNGADGVHLLKVNEKDYQLIFGESKLHADLTQGIYKAFESIGTLLENRSKKLNFEIDLVNSQLLKDTFDDQTYNTIKKILLPSAREDATNMDYSFGIFLGFDLAITEEELKKKNSDFRDAVRARIKKEIEEKVESINFQIRKEHFTGYNFYLYIIPFSDLAKNRLEIIKSISE
ncbi:HamA C-terminal domain-containing protein [Pedobacter chitinilyticus]|uniref:DUF1837 domain-containing protein n=1 Tax=Pedobacter chitinilyticus TaxID=2233776 RepID=A0A3S3QG32_9SPHI|nr:DUF1837 domain-containing protein [Pedobacter chitinilyticus]RWU08190.1 DUF1837 domain-containing protein [Pedobacter chitinilyticus]